MYDYVFTSPAMGLSGKVNFSLTDNLHTFDKTVSDVSAPWQYEGVRSANNNCSQDDGINWNFKSAAAPAFNTADLALSIRVAEDGEYQMNLSFITQTYGVIADVYLAPKPDDFSLAENTSIALKNFVNELTDDSRIGTVDFYGEGEKKTVSLNSASLTAGDYLLIFVCNGANESFAALNGTYAGHPPDALDADGKRLRR